MHANNIACTMNMNDIPVHLPDSQLKVQSEPVNVANIRGHSTSSEMEESKELKNVELTKRKTTFAYMDGGLRSITIPNIYKNSPSLWM